jgi:hypothetical protein
MLQCSYMQLLQVPCFLGWGPDLGSGEQDNGLRAWQIFWSTEQLKASPLVLSMELGSQVLPRFCYVIITSTTILLI